MFLTVYRSAANYYVCADDWEENLSRLACKQMGFGLPCKSRNVVSLLCSKEGKILICRSTKKRENAKVWKVVFGINNLDHPSVFMQTRLVKTIILHPRYNRAVVDYDISIVELNEGINETSYGDSGGPLVCEQPAGRWTLFGLTSWGSVCFSKVFGPGVYSNVSHFLEWIEREIYLHTFLIR
ncbi:Atrial natriuretic peptide-converting enzyme, partial [Ophiophagus hannah]